MSKKNNTSIAQKCTSCHIVNSGSDGGKTNGVMNVARLKISIVGRAHNCVIGTPPPRQRNKMEERQNDKV